MPGHIVNMVLRVDGVGRAPVMEFAAEWEAEIKEKLHASLIENGLTPEQADCFTVVGVFVGEAAT